MTARDVAKRAGVSQSTVSRVLNNYKYVSPEVRQRVLQAIEELNYKPNQVARSLATSRSCMIGLLVADFNNPFYPETAHGIVEACRAYGYNVILGTTNNNQRVQAELIQSLRAQQVDGLILGSVQMGDPTVTELIESGFPCVLYNRIVHPDSGSYVVVDNRKGGRRAVEHLYSLGHRRIAILRGPHRFSTFAHRLEGFQEAMRELGLKANLCIDFAAYAKDRRGTIQRLLSGPAAPTAIFAVTDNYALDLLNTLGELGVRVPEDIALVGFDDISLASHSLIGLTTFTQQQHLQGRLAVEALMELIRARDQGRTVPPTRIVLEPQFIIRRTCGAQTREIS